MGAIAAALTVVIGWGETTRWISIAVLTAAFGLSFLVYRRSAVRRRKARQKVEPLSVVPFVIRKDARFPAEASLRKGRRATAALGMAGLFLGGAASGGWAVPVMGAMAGAALGGAFERFINPTDRIRERMLADVGRFMAVARPEVTRYVLEAHERLLEEVTAKITDSYQERVKSTVNLLTAGR